MSFMSLLSTLCPLKRLVIVQNFREITVILKFLKKIANIWKYRLTFNAGLCKLLTPNLIRVKYSLSCVAAILHEYVDETL
jgi:hypothetical protein